MENGNKTATKVYDGRTKFEAQEPGLRMLAEKGKLGELQRNAAREAEYLESLDKRVRG